MIHVVMALKRQTNRDDKLCRIQDIKMALVQHEKADVQSENREKIIKSTV